MRIPSLKEVKMNPNATYIVTGGFGGLGRAIVRWLASIGSRYFIIPSRSGATSNEAKALLDEMKALGVGILADNCDIADPVQLECLITKASSTMPPIRGVIQGAMVLKVRYEAFTTYMIANRIS
jgi:NAD(P)-dependent dehydrogenase (short-subunit alcohol dehydrogenase family)